MELSQIEVFLGWCTVINIGILLFSTIVLAVAKEPIAEIHSRIIRLSQKDLSNAYFQYLAIYKIGILLFNLTPYIALKLMS